MQAIRVSNLTQLSGLPFQLNAELKLTITENQLEEKIESGTLVSCIFP